MKKQIIISLLVFLLLITAMYTSENPSCENKEICFNELPTVQQKVGELKSLSVGDVSYIDLQERSLDIPTSIGALYEEARLYKELAQIKAEYEGVSKEALNKPIPVKQKQEQPTTPEQPTTKIPQRQQAHQTGIYSNSVEIADGTASRNYVVQYTNDKWYWCKAGIFTECSEDKKPITATSPKRGEVDEKIYPFIFNLENQNYDNGLEFILRNLVSERVAQANTPFTVDMSFEVNDKKVEVGINSKAGKVAAAILNIGGTKFTLAGTQVDSFINGEYKSESISFAFKNLVTGDVEINQPAVSILSYEIELDDGTFGSNYIVEYKDNKWYWCKARRFFGGCSDKKAVTETSPNESEILPTFYPYVSSLASLNYEIGLNTLLQTLVSQRVAQANTAFTADMGFEVNDKKVEVANIKLKGGEVQELTLSIGNKKLILKGKQIEDFITVGSRDASFTDYFMKIAVKSDKGTPLQEPLVERLLSTCKPEELPGEPTEADDRKCQEAFGNDEFVAIKQDAAICCDANDRNLCCTKKSVIPHLERLRSAVEDKGEEMIILDPVRTPAEQRDAFLDYLDGGILACAPRGLAAEKISELRESISSTKSPGQPIWSLTEWLNAYEPESLRIINDLAQYNHCQHVVGFALDLRFEGLPLINKKIDDMSQSQVAAVKEFREFMCEAGWANLGSEWWHYEVLSTGYQNAVSNNRCYFNRLVGPLAETEPGVRPNYV